jgi:antitoxin component YwqK of YwqJK toxin-antitoxin module
MIYKGGMKAGIKHGYGKEFFTNGKLGFIGGFEDGKYCGAICKVFYYTGGIYYKGQMARGKKEGHGVLYNKCGR